MYHDVFRNDIKESGFQNTGAIPYKLNSHAFEDQICIISKFCDTGKLGKSQIALTFDDGGESAHTIIAPILEKYGFKGFFFITTSLTGTTGFMNKEQILDLHNRGHYIGAHSHTHPRNISNLSVTEIAYEWTKSVETLNKIISSQINVASIPGGFYSEQSRIKLHECGIKTIFTSIPTKKIEYNSDNQQIIGRFTIKNETSAEVISQLLSNNSMALIYQFAKWRGLALVRSALGNNYYRIREILLKNQKSI